MDKMRDENIAGREMDEKALEKWKTAYKNCKKQRSIIKQQAIDTGLITDIKVTKVEGMRYGFADFESAGVVKETQYLPENMWKMSDAEQFKWLDEQIGGTVDGYTWHHTEIPVKCN